MTEELLCPLKGPSVHTTTGGHLVTFVRLTHMGTVIFNDTDFTVLPDSSLKFPSADGYVGQYTDLPFALTTNSPQVPLYPTH
jgi:hypothetical protein